MMSEVVYRDTQCSCVYLLIKISIFTSKLLNPREINTGTEAVYKPKISSNVH